MADLEIQTYFLQDHVAPSEGPMACEVSRAEFLEWGQANPDAQMDFDEETSGLYLRFDLTTAEGGKVFAPVGGNEVYGNE